MKTIKIRPDFLKKNKIEGDLEIKIPHARDRANYLKKMALKMDNESGEVSVSSDPIDLLMVAVDICEDCITECSMKWNGLDVSKDDLFYDPIYQELLSDICNIVLNGIKPSKN